MSRSNDPCECTEALAAECLAGRLRLMHRVVMGIYDDALRAEGCGYAGEPDEHSGPSNDGWPEQIV